MSKSIWPLLLLSVTACSSHETTNVTNYLEDDSSTDSPLATGGAGSGGTGSGGSGGSVAPEASAGGSGGTVALDAGNDATGGTGNTTYADPCTTIPPATPGNRIKNCDSVGSCGVDGPTCPDGCYAPVDSISSGTYMVFKSGERIGNQCSMCSSFGKSVAMSLPVKSGECVRVSGAYFTFDTENGCEATAAGCAIGVGISPGGSLRETHLTAFAPSQPSWLMYEAVQLVDGVCPLTCP